jgi:hypothetical protein
LHDGRPDGALVRAAALSCLLDPFLSPSKVAGSISVNRSTVCRARDRMRKEIIRSFDNAQTASAASKIRPNGSPPSKLAQRSPHP